VVGGKRALRGQAVLRSGDRLWLSAVLRSLDGVVILFLVGFASQRRALK
jgi:hypothetical protein